MSKDQWILIGAVAVGALILKGLLEEKGRDAGRVDIRRYRGPEGEALEAEWQPPDYAGHLAVRAVSSGIRIGQGIMSQL